MRKPQSQPALASLSEADREQLADWLRRDSYDAVLERVRQPRPEGFGLSISKKPLQTFYAKVALLDLINSRLPEDKQLTLATFESLAAGDVLPRAASAPSATASERAHEIHDTVLDTTHDLATSGDNTPTQLLALQRLADFPARAALRDQMAEIQAERLQLQREREERAKEMQAHKIAMDLRREERADRKEKRCAETDARKIEHNREQSARAAKRLEFTAKGSEFAAKRLRLSTKSLALRRRQHRDRMALARERMENNSQRATNGSAKKPDHLGPIATNWKEVGERVCKLFGITPEEEARRAELHKTWKDPHARPGIPEEINPVD